MPSRHAPSVLLLEHPRPHDPSRFQEVVNAPLSACLFSPYIVSLLRSRGIEVELLDAHLMGLSMQETLKELKNKFVGAHCRASGRFAVANNVSLLGVHLVYLWEKTEEVFNLLSQIRAQNTQVHINLYGYYPTFAFQEILRLFPFIDSVTLGEPEYPFLELAKALTPLNPPLEKGEWGIQRERRAPDLSHVKGLAYRKGGEIIFNHKGEISEPDDLPFPDRALLPLYQAKGLTTYILGSRGCYGQCTFCYVGPFYGWQGHSRRWRGRSPENILEELQGLYEKGVRYFYFADANFFGPGSEGKERARRLADLIIKEGLNIRFGMECRANDLEKESLARLVEAGLREVFLGVENACDQTLKRFRKDITQEVNRRAIELLRGFGIEPNLGFIMFEPHSRLQDIRTNFKFLRDTKLLRSPAVTAHLLSHKQTLFKGTLDYHKSKDRAEALSKMDRLEAQSLRWDGYEAQYDFEDPKVRSFYGVVSKLCNGVLFLLSPKEAQCCAIPQSDRNYLLKANRTLVDTYEKILYLYEGGDGQKRALRLAEEALKVCRGVLSYTPTTSGTT